VFFPIPFISLGDKSVVIRSKTLKEKLKKLLEFGEVFQRLRFWQSFGL